VKIASEEMTLQTASRKIRVKNDEGGTTFIALPNGTTYEKRQALREKNICWVLPKEQ
jgi:hypothetical protein